MQRRVALKNIALAIGGLMALPAWANGWSEASIQHVSPYLTANQDALLAEIVETILPATETPGAKDLKIQSFVQKMILDCYETEVQENVKEGLKAANNLAKQNYGKAFITGTNLQREAVLTQMETSTNTNWSSFYKLVKELTLQGYLTSEYYLTTHTNYKMIPGHYYGCVPVSSSQTLIQK